LSLKVPKVNGAFQELTPVLVVGDLPPEVYCPAVKAKVVFTGAVLVAP
jgi:hypothetical protein